MGNESMRIDSWALHQGRKTPALGAEGWVVLAHRTRLSGGLGSAGLGGL